MTSVNKFFTQTSLLGYFRSGWAFFLPYLSAYLLYAVLKWPVNPSESFSGSVTPFPFHPPSLLGIYWGLHGLHLLLGGFALHGWWRGSAEAVTGPQPQPTALRLWPLLPWALLGLLVVLPGIYMEFPADPLAHLARISEWGRIDRVLDHSTWSKTSYFLAYSLAGAASDPLDAPGLLLYYGIICLLLCWQYYRLARQLDFSPPLAFLFGALQLALHGNSVFSFHRYYGLSSTLVSQLAAVALVHAGISWLRFPREHPLPRTVVVFLALIALVCFNHLQGLLLAAVSLAALGGWHLATHRRKLLLATALLMLMASVWVVLAGQAASADSALAWLRTAGWLNAAGGFSVFDAASPSYHFVRDVLGTVGVASLAVGGVMLAYNHPGGWLVVVPAALLVIPATAAPLALYLHAHNPTSLTIFARQLLAIPVALPFVWILSMAAGSGALKQRAAIGVLVGALALLALPSRYHYNRLWQMLARPPADLEMAALERQAGAIRQLANQATGIKVISPWATGYILQLHDVQEVQFARRVMPGDRPGPAIEVPLLENSLAQFNRRRTILLVAPRFERLISAASQTGQLSFHWLPQQVALDQAGTTELETWARTNGYAPVATGSAASIWMQP